MTYARMHDALKDDGFVIYAGQGTLAKSLFRFPPWATSLGPRYRQAVELLHAVAAMRGLWVARAAVLLGLAAPCWPDDALACSGSAAAAAAEPLACGDAIAAGSAIRN